MQRTGVLIAAALTVLVLGLPLTILLVLDPSTSQASCGTSGSPTGPGPTKVPGIPQKFLPIYEGAAQHFQLGSSGWAYLAALNYAESGFGTDNGPGTGVLSGSNYAGAAGPMQIGIGGAASDGWDEYKVQIPPNLPAGAEPPSVYNETDAVYVGAAMLRAARAPGDWLAALKSWNDYPPEIAEVTQLVAQYTQSSQGQRGSPAALANVTSSPPGGDGLGGDCTPVSGPTSPGAQSKILPNGIATIPQDAPPAVQRAIAAGNRIIDTFYSQERRANMLTQVQDSYDCSGSSAYVLYQAGLSDPTVNVGNGIAGNGVTMEAYGQPGSGQWITVFASDAHEFLKVDNIVLDTAWYAPVQPGTVPDSYPPDDPANGGSGSGPRWQPASMITAQLGDGNAWTERHPQGL